MSLSLKERFDQDKDFLISQTNEFLAGNKHLPPPLQTNRDEIIKAVEDENFTDALQKLEILREEKTGIKLTRIRPLVEIEGATGVIVRDARNAKEPRVFGTEGHEMQYLNAVRAAIDIAKIENKPELEAQLKKEAKKFIVSFNALNMKESQENIAINIKNNINDIAVFLEKNSIEEVHKKLNVAKDFQNFNDEHCNIVTLSNIKDKQGKDHTVIEAEVALKGITDEQQLEYQNRADKKWFTEMPVWERQLVNKYAEVIKDGDHVISTQLRQIVGMKNAFEKITAIAEENKPLEIIHTSKHAGTLASLSRDDNSRQEITNLNSRQAGEWMGKDHVLHTNTLNSGNANFKLPHQDAILVTYTKRAMDHVGGYNTNTAFNIFRLSAACNNLNGVKEQLNDLVNNLPKEGNFADIATHLKPRGKFERLFGLNKPKGNLQGLLDIAVRTHNLPPETIKILTDSADLRKDVEKADVVFFRGMDKENISSSISRKLNNLSYQVLNSKDPILRRVPKHEVLTMCASGKDRTGLAEHDQTSSAIAARLGIEVQDADKQLLKAGHTAGQAGGVYAGGATIGCHGTLKVTAQGFPETRKEALKSMIEATGANNKIKKLKKGTIINEKEEQKKALELPNMYKDEEYKTLQSNIQVAANKEQGQPKSKSTKVAIGNLKPSITHRLTSNKDQNISI